MPRPARALRGTLLAIAFLGAAVVGRAQSGGVEEAVDLPRAETIFPQLEPILVAALAQSPSMIQESLTRLAATYDEQAERSVLYPRLGGYGHFYIQREDRLDAADSIVGERTYYDVSLSQPVYHWGSLKAAADIGRISRQIADRNYVEAYQNFANRIRDAYLQLVAMRVAQRNRALELERARAQLEVVREQVDEKRLPGGAVTSAQFAIEAKELAGDRADFALRRVLRQFQELTGSQDFALEDVPATIPAVTEVAEARSLPLRTEYVTRRGYENSPGYFRANRLLDIERLRLRITRNSLRPKFNFATGISQDLDQRSANVEQRFMVTTMYVGFRVNWAIWDSKHSQSVARATQARIRRAEKSLEQLEKDLIESIEAAEKELGFSTRGLRIAERGYAGAESTYRATLDLQKEGRASQADVETALLAWRAAEVGVCEARRDYLRTVATFLATVEADPLIDKLQSEGRIPR